MREIERQYKEIIEQDKAMHYQSGQQALAYIQNSTAKYHGRCVRTLYMPKIFEPQDIAIFQSLIERLYSIFNKVVDHYLRDEQYRALFGFDRRLEKLILLPALYPSRIPVARIDIFYDEETRDFRFCEFNTDGTSAMNEDRELNQAVRLTKAFCQFAATHELRSFELFDTLADELVRIYQTTADPKERPHAAIVDFMESATENEFCVVADSLEKAGCSVRICEIRDLMYDGKHLYSPDGMRIDFIYRRAVTCDIMAHYDEVQPFLQAVKAGAVVLLGDFRTQIVHNKIFYQIVQAEQTLAFLNEEERTFVRKHFPYTERLEHDRIPVGRLLEQREQWIIKPEDSYGSKGVFAGTEYSQQEWERLVPQYYGRHYIAQQFCRPCRSVNIDLMKSKDAEFAEYSNITGLYVYNGTFYGIYSRVAECSVISTQYSEMAVATLLCDGAKQ